jgi:Ca2+-transporting ATPase
MGFTITIGSLSVFLLSLFLSGNLDLARTMAFTTLVVYQLGYVFHCRSWGRVSLNNFTGNPWLLAAVGSSLALQAAVLYLPWLQGVFRTVPLSGFQLGIVLLLAWGGTLVSMVFHTIFRRLGRKLVYVRV